MAKRARSTYASRARSTDWLKIKTGKRQEVVVGFTAPRRSRRYFGSLCAGLLGPVIVKVGLRRLPGDIVIERDNFRLHIRRRCSSALSFP
jgi:hypothetical protein